MLRDNECLCLVLILEPKAAYAQHVSHGVLQGLSSKTPPLMWGGVVVVVLGVGSFCV